MEYSNSPVARVLDNSVEALARYDYPGLIGVEAATAYWGLSTYNPQMPIFLINDDTLDHDGYFARCALSILFVPGVNRDNIVKLSQNLSITNREQTICDMIRYNRHEFHLFEAVLSAYEDGKVDIERLENMAEQYDILDRLHQIYEEASEELS